jgi:thymidine kinase
MSLTLYIGPMFAGKTNSLIAKYVEGETLAFKNSIDKRYEDGARIVSHDGLSIPAWSYYNIPLFSITEMPLGIKTVLIDEGQFFPNLREACEHYSGVLVMDVYVSALSGTSELGAWDSVSNIIPICDDIQHLKAKLCMRCHKRAAPFTAVKYGVVKKGTVKVGGSKDYDCVCRDCFEKNNVVLD